MFLTLILSASKVVDEYNRREQEIKHLEKELEDKNNALNAYRQNISEVHDYDSSGSVFFFYREIWISVQFLIRPFCEQKCV